MKWDLSMTRMTRRVLTPSVYIVAMEDFCVPRSLRIPMSSNHVRKTILLLRTCGKESSRTPSKWKLMSGSRLVVSLCLLVSSAVFV